MASASAQWARAPVGRHHRPGRVVARARASSKGGRHPRGDVGKTSALLDPTPASSTVTAGGEDILGEVPADRPLSYKLERKEGGGVGSSHPDAVRRRLRSERRKEKRRMIYDAGLEWWQVVKDCSSNIHIAECSDEYYYALRLARAAGRDAVVQYFSPRCGACKEEAAPTPLVGRKRRRNLRSRVALTRVIANWLCRIAHGQGGRPSLSNTRICQG